MKLVVEPFIKTYQDSVIRLISNIQRNEFNIPITPEEQPDLKDIPNFYQKNRGNFWLARDGRKVVGAVALLDISDGRGALRKMFVDRDYRGEEIGVAKKLLETLLAWARSNEFGKIFLGTTPKFLAAHRFYEKNGFVEISRERLPETFPIMKVDTKFYMLPIGEGEDRTASGACK